MTQATIVHCPMTGPAKPRIRVPAGSLRLMPVIRNNIPVPSGSLRTVPVIQNSIPPCTNGRKWPFRDMKVGDNFFVLNFTAGEFGGRVSYARKSTGYRFAMRTESHGVRIWRIA